MECEISQQEKAGAEEIWISRATLRRIEAGFSAGCLGCRSAITFSPKEKGRTKVIANVYDEGVWQRVEHYHGDCYQNVGEPYGPASEHPQMKATVESIAVAAAMASEPEAGAMATSGNKQGV